MDSDNPDIEYNRRELAKIAGAGARVQRLGENLETAGMLAWFGQLRYTKGFSDGQLLREFCDEYTPEPYFPTADSRPTADRLKWGTGLTS